VTFRRIYGLARPELRTLLIGTFFLLIGSGTSLLYPQAMRLIIDEALGARNRDLIDKAALGMTAVFAVQAVAVALRFRLFTHSGVSALWCAWTAGGMRQFLWQRGSWRPGAPESREPLLPASHVFSLPQWR
jgi:ABC-type multidrug transport system fused ATPase/permease subunit